MTAVVHGVLTVIRGVTMACDGVVIVRVCFAAQLPALMLGSLVRMVMTLTVSVHEQCS